MGEEEGVLLTGLPEDIGLDCLARVPQRYHPDLRLVCRRWRDLIATTAFHRHRERIGVAEDIVFLVQALIPPPDTKNQERSPEMATAGSAAPGDDEAKEKTSSATGFRPPAYGLTLYNATTGEWLRVSPPPGTPAIPMFAQCVAAGGKLFLVGGWDPATLEPSPGVWILDPATGLWRRGAAMGSARSFFACAAAGGRVYVGGGHDGAKNALRSAEAYDLAVDTWAALPPMAEERDEPAGAPAPGGGFWVVSGYRTENQGRFDTAAEKFDPATGEWKKEDGIWAAAAAEGGTATASAALLAVNGRLWSIGKSGIREYEGEGRGWRAVAPAPEGMGSSPCAVLIPAGAGYGGEMVFVMAAAEGSGGVGHRAWVFEIRNNRWTRVEAPPGFSGFVYSASAIRL